jgi:hypothetical protein
LKTRDLNSLIKDEEGWPYIFRGKNPLKLDRILRYYFHLQVQEPIQQAETVSRFAQTLECLGNYYDLPFEFKYFNSTARYVQSDSFVLYTNQRYFELFSLIVGVLLHEFKAELVDRTPFFAKSVATGVGFAEDPTSGESFGRSRSGLIANFLVKHRKEIAQESTRNAHFLINRLIDSLTQNGYNILCDEFFRNPNTAFRYPFHLWQFRAAAPNTPFNKYLLMAITIARKICRETIWINESENQSAVRWLNTTADSTVTVTLTENEQAGIVIFLASLTKIYSEPIIEKVISFAKTETIYIPSEPIITKNSIWLQINQALTEEKDLLKQADYRMILNEIEELLKAELPLPNVYGHDYFSPTITHGYAGIGYLLLRFINVDLPPLLQVIE